MSSNVALGAGDRSEASSAFPLAEALLGASLFGASCISILLTRVPGGIALFWPCSAIAGAVLIRLHRVRWIAATLSVFFSFALSSILAAHRPWRKMDLYQSRPAEDARLLGRRVPFDAARGAIKDRRLEEQQAQVGKAAVRR